MRRSGELSVEFWWCDPGRSVGRNLMVDRPNPESFGIDQQFFRRNLVSHIECVHGCRDLSQPGRQLLGAHRILERKLVDDSVNGQSEELPRSWLAGWRLLHLSLSIALPSVVTRTPNFHTATLAEVWNGTVWSLEKTLNPTSPTANSPECRAWQRASALPSEWLVLETLAEVWNGTNWSIMKTRNPPHAGTSLTSVSCTSTSFCAAVGAYYAHATGRYLTLAESWDGTTVVHPNHPRSKSVR